LPDFIPYLVPLDDFIKDPATNPAWDDVLPAFKEKIVSWGGSVYALPLDGDTHSLFYRRDIFENKDNQAKFKAKYNYDLKVPDTMEQLRDVAEFFTGWDWNGDGKTDYGWAAPMARGTQTHWWFWNFTAPYSVMPGKVDQYHGVLYFDPVTMKPLINEEGYVKGLTLYRDMGKFGPPGMVAWGVSEIRAAAPGGNIAMWMEWGSFPGLCEDPKAASKAMIGNCGTTVRPGANEVWDRENKTWVKMDKPNKVPLLAAGGWVAAITKTCKNPKAAYDFMKFMNSPEISIQDVVRGDTGFNVYRFSQIKDLAAWTKAGFGEQDAKEYLAAVQADLENPNVLTDLRIPAKPEYVDTTLDLYVSMALAGEMEPKAALDTIYEEWEKITERMGRDKQLKIYRTMLGLE
jgi:multiple sugar transport system substrate-binding protein